MLMVMGALCARLGLEQNRGHAIPLLSGRLALRGGRGDRRRFDMTGSRERVDPTNGVAGPVDQAHMSRLPAHDVSTQINWETVLQSKTEQWPENRRGLAGEMWA